MNNLEIITNKIHIIRNQIVMLDYDLAALYEINKSFKTISEKKHRKISRRFYV